MKRKSKQIIISCMLIILILTIYGCSKLQEDRDISIAEAYITSTYGSNYQIIGYTPRENRASGLSPAQVKVKQNGIEYLVDVSGGQVVGDNYSEYYAGNIVYNYILDCMQANGTLPDLSGRDVKINSQFSTIEFGRCSVWRVFYI